MGLACGNFTYAAQNAMSALHPIADLAATVAHQRILAKLDAKKRVQVRRPDLTSHGSSHGLPSLGCWEDTLQKVADFIGAEEKKHGHVRFTPESGHVQCS
jgi:hypothetical protein